MRNIKKIAGDVLLCLYFQKRKKAYAVSHDILMFKMENDKICIVAKTEFGRTISKICEDSGEDAYNAFRYLKEKGFILLQEEQFFDGGAAFMNINVTSSGVDIIEGIEREKAAKQNFEVTFNIKLADNINIESLLRAELGSLIKAALI